MSGFRTTPNLGPALDSVYTAMPFWDAQLGVASGGVELALRGRGVFSARATVKDRAGEE